MLFVDRVVDVKFVAKCLIWLAITTYVVFFWVYFHTFSFNFNISGSHSVWYEFFSMLGGLGGFLSPIAAAATIAFLYAQHKESIDNERNRHDALLDDASKVTERKESLDELRNCTQFLFETINYRYPASYVANSITKQIMHSGYEFACRIDPTTKDIGIHIEGIEGCETVTILNNGDLGAWLSLASRMATHLNHNYFIKNKDLDDDFVNQVRALKSQLVHVINLAMQCERLEVSVHVVRYHLSKVHSVAYILHKHHVINEHIYNHHKRLFLG